MWQTLFSKIPKSIIPIAIGSAALGYETAAENSPSVYKQVCRNANVKDSRGALEMIILAGGFEEKNLAKSLDQTGIFGEDRERVFKHVQNTLERLKIDPKNVNDYKRQADMLDEELFGKTLPTFRAVLYEHRVLEWEAADLASVMIHDATIAVSPGGRLSLDGVDIKAIDYDMLLGEGGYEHGV